MSDWIERTARKPHRCDFCGESIEAGSRYMHVRLRPWDHPDNDGFGSWHAHKFCAEVWNKHIGHECDWGWADDPSLFKDDAERCAPGRHAEYPWDRDCTACDGTGLDDEGNPPCSRCDGTGSAYKRQRALATTGASND